MGKTYRRFVLIAATAFLALAAMLFGAISQAGLFAAAEEADATQSALNEKLVVKYSMDDTSTGNGAKLAAYNWDSVSQTFVRNSAADATVQNSVNNKNTGAVSSVSGMEGSGALSFTGKAHARANFTLPSDATGMTVSMLVKNINYYWSSLIEFWDGTDGGRFGKGTMQGNGGRKNEGDPWSANASAHTTATMAAGGGWDSFVINVNSGDNGGATVDPMKADTWYQVTFVLSGNEMKAYRDGVLKQTFNKGDANSIVTSILKAAKSSNGKLGIRLCHDTTNNDADVLDDLRIYSGALTEEEIRATLHPFIGTVPEYYAVTGLGYPSEILLDGATSVSEAGGKMTGVTARGVSYSYTPVSYDKTTLSNDEKGIDVTLTQNGATREAKMKFRRTLNLEAERLGYKIGDGDNVNLAVPTDRKSVV